MGPMTPCYGRCSLVAAVAAVEVDATPRREEVETPFRAESATIKGCGTEEGGTDTFTFTGKAPRVPAQPSALRKQ